MAAKKRGWKYAHLHSPEVRAKAARTRARNRRLKEREGGIRGTIPMDAVPERPQVARKGGKGARAARKGGNQEIVIRLLEERQSFLDLIRDLLE